MTEHKTTSKSKFCLECEKPMKQNEKEEWFCPNCGYKLEKKNVEKEPTKAPWAICCGGAIVLLIIIMIIGSLNDGGDSSSSSANSYKSSSSGKMCTWTKAIYYDGREKVMGIGCPSGETCTKSSSDLDGDGLLCTQVPASEGIMQVCDGVCK